MIFIYLQQQQKRENELMIVFHLLLITCFGDVY